MMSATRLVSGKFDVSNWSFAPFHGRFEKDIAEVVGEALAVTFKDSPPDLEVKIPIESSSLVQAEFTLPFSTEEFGDDEPKYSVDLRAASLEALDWSYSMSEHESLEEWRQAARVLPKSLRLLADELDTWISEKTE